MSTKLMRYVQSENGELHFHILENGVWKYYRRAKFVQADSPCSTPGYRTFQYYSLLGYELLPPMAEEYFRHMTRLRAYAS